MSAEGGDGGGGHGASWIVTYSDMITLLMTLFIVIVTFGNKDKGSKKNDSIVGGKGGSGGAGLKEQPADGTSVLVRVTPLGRYVVHGSEAPPMYSELSDDPVESVLNALSETPAGRLSDNYRLRVSTAFLFADKEQLSDSGARALQSIAAAVRQLPYDFQIQVGSAERLPQAARVMQYLFQVAGIHPGRIGISVRPLRDGSDESIWLTLVRNR